MSAVTLTTGTDGVALITLDVEGRPMNVLTPELRAELRAAIDRVAGDPAIRGAIVTSAKKTFMAGADLKDIAAQWGQFTHRQAFERSQATSSLYRRIETCGKPIVAAINGLALGGGFELCLACHRRILVDDPRAVVGLPEVTVGLLPGGGGTQRLPRLIDPATAVDLLLEGKPIAPAEALRIGLVHALAAPADLIATAREWLLRIDRAAEPWDRGSSPSLPDRWFDERLARVPAEIRACYPASRAILSAVREGSAVSFDEGLAIESAHFADLLSGPVAQNIVRTMFVSKGNADRSAQRPASVPRHDIKRVAVTCERENPRLLAVLAKAGIEVVDTPDCDLAIVVGDAPDAHAIAMQMYAVPGLAPLIEIAVSPSASAEAVARCLDLAGQLRMTPVVSRAARGVVARMRDAFDDEVARMAPAAAEPWPSQVLCRVALVAMQALDAGEIVDPAALDVASVFGAGYPAWTGGALSYADTQGVESFVAQCQHLAAQHGERFTPPAALLARARDGRQFYGVRRIA